MVIFYAAIEIVEIKGEVYVKHDKKMSTKEKCKRSAIGIWKGLLIHYSELWNWIDLIFIITSFISCVIWLEIITDDFLTSYWNDDPKDFESQKIIDGFAEVVRLYKIYE